MKHTIRYRGKEEDIFLEVPWGLGSGRIPPPAIIFYGGSWSAGREFFYTGTVEDVEDKVVVYDEVRAERVKQIAQGYDDEHDNAHGAQELAQVAISYTTRAINQGNRSDLVKAAALLVAAIQTVDRLLSFDEGTDASVV